MQQSPMRRVFLLAPIQMTHFSQSTYDETLKCFQEYFSRNQSSANREITVRASQDIVNIVYILHVEEFRAN